MAALKAPHRARLGFIGIGLMGLPMTLRLLEHGWVVTVTDKDPTRLLPAIEAGAKAARTAAEVTAASDVVLVCVNDTAGVETVVFGENGVAEAATIGKVLVDHSTADAERTRAMASKLKNRGMGWVDAPVSGGPPAASEGALAIMAGGEPQDIDTVRPVMERLSHSFTHMGTPGAGQVTKMINQIIAGVTFAVLAEAVKMAENAGLDARRIPECLAGGYADSTMLQRIYPRMAARQFEPPAGLAKQMLKDLEMVAELGRTTNTPTPMAAQAAVLYRLLVARGHGDDDTISVLRLYDREQ